MIRVARIEVHCLPRVHIAQSHPAGQRWQQFGFARFGVHPLPSPSCADGGGDNASGQRRQSSKWLLLCATDRPRY